MRHGLTWGAGIYALLCNQLVCFFMLSIRKFFSIAIQKCGALSLHRLMLRHAVVGYSMFMVLVTAMPFAYAGSAILKPISLTTPHINNANAGSLPGSLTANGGAAGYSIPLALPPGTNGLVPVLSLNYSSQGGNGQVGLGWSLNGFSSIHKCGRTIAQDGYVEALNYVGDTRLCLNGQRLIRVDENGSNTPDGYWGFGGEYRTEMDSFSRISSYLDEVAMRIAFRVETRDGLIQYYGSSEDSVVEARGPNFNGETHSWVLQRTEDRFGNRVLYEYNENPTNGEHLPKQIRWGNRTSLYGKVTFEYEARPDREPGFLAGGRVDRTQRLKAIKTYTDTASDGKGGTAVHSYTLTYATSKTSGRSILTQVQGCDGQGLCLPATTFKWGEPNPTAAKSFVFKGEWIGPNLEDATGLIDPARRNEDDYKGGKDPLDMFVSGDFNGDGKTDLLEKYKVVSNGVVQKNPKLFISTGEGFTEYDQFLLEQSTFRVAEVGDFDGDGRLDVLGALGEDNPNGLPAPEFYTNWRLCFSRSTVEGAPTFECQKLVLPVGQNTNLRMLNDFNGDGRTDIYWSGGSYLIGNKGRQSMCLAVRDGFDCKDVTNTEFVIPLGGTPENQGVAPAHHASADFNGDGRADQIKLERPTLVYDTGVKWWDFTNGAVYSKEYRAPGDLNAEPAGSGNKLFDYGAFKAIGFDPYTGGALSGDFNGDGYTDVMIGYGPIDTAVDGVVAPRVNGRICYGKGSGGADCSRTLPPSGYSLPKIPDRFTGNPYLPEDWPILGTGDFDRDGKLDLITTLTGATGTEARTYKLCHIKNDGDTSLVSNYSCDRWDFPSLPINTNTRAYLEEPRTILADFDGDGTQDIAVYSLGGKWNIYSASRQAMAGEALDKIVSTINGLGLESRVEYADAGNADVYLPQLKVSQADGSALSYSYPYKGLPGAGILVKKLSTSTGQGGWQETTYRYGGAATHQGGRGHQGFAWIESTDLDSGIVTETWQRQDWPFTGQVIRSVSRSRAGVTLSDSRTTASEVKVLTHSNGSQTSFTVVTAGRVDKRDLNGDDLGTTSTITSYDDWGTLLSKTVDVKGPWLHHRTITTNTPENMDTTRLAAWRIGEIQKTTVSKQRDNRSVVSTIDASSPAAIVRTVNFSYNSKGQLESDTVEPGNSVLQIKTTYGYNSFGLLSSKSLAWSDRDLVSGSLIARSLVIETAEYDPLGRFVIRATNALNQGETRQFDSKTGVMLSITGPNGLATRWEVDGFGRKQKEVRADGTETHQSIKLCDSGCPSYAVSVLISEAYKGNDRISVPTLVYQDALGRTLRSKTWGFDGTEIYVDQEYDNQGHLTKTYQPYFAGKTRYVAKEIGGYDDLDRPTSVKQYDEQGASQETLTQYDGLVTTTTNPKGHKKSDHRDLLGQLGKAVDAAGKETFFDRDAWGNLTKTVDPTGNEIKVVYDLLGRKTELKDPDLGWIEYTLDPLGRTIKQVSPNQRAKGQSTTLRYDDLGRMIERKEPDLSSYWVYDSLNGAAACASTKSCGQLVMAYTQTGNVKDYQRTQSYDSFGRPNNSIIDLGNGKSVTSYSRYDDWGRLIETEHKRDTVSKRYQQRYNNWGYLERIESAGAMLWQANKQDAANRVLEAALGNGSQYLRSYDDNTGRLASASLKRGVDNIALLQEAYLYDSIGNVTQRTHSWSDGTTLSETFGYDALNRLSSAQVAGKNAESFNYDASGNLISKTGVGFYGYAPHKGGVGSRPHAVSSLSRTLNGTAYRSYGYDANGNLSAVTDSEDNGYSRTVNWTSFDMVQRMSRGTGSAEYWSEFTYGPEHQRSKQISGKGTATEKTTWYLGGIELEESQGQLTQKTYMPNGLGVEIDKPGQATERLWNYLDHLGSPIALIGTDSQGKAVLKDQLGFDAWGNRRKPNGSATDWTKHLDNRGYTGHEMLDDQQLVHMNGRIYEPSIGRFLSADPLIQDPEHSQSYNRYSYVWNNPLNNTDPSGFECEAKTGSHICRPKEALAQQVQSAIQSGKDIQVMGENGKVVEYVSNKQASTLYAAAATSVPDNKNSVESKAEANKSATGSRGSGVPKQVGGLRIISPASGTEKYSGTNECVHTRMCGNESTSIRVNGNRVARTHFVHTEIQVSNGYEFSIYEAQPVLGSDLEGGKYLPNKLYLVGATEDGPNKGNGPNWGSAFSFKLNTGSRSTEIASKIKEAASLYKDYTIYALPNLGQDYIYYNGYNSNSYVSGLLKYANPMIYRDWINEIDIFAAKKWLTLPGLTRPLPIR